MQLRDIVRELRLTVCSGESQLDRAVGGGYAGDLMSDVLAHAAAGNIWVTMQIHPTIVAIAVQKQIAAIIVSQGRKLDPETLQRALENEVVLLVSGQSSFETIAALVRLGVS